MRLTPSVVILVMSAFELAPCAVAQPAPSPQLIEGPTNTAVGQNALASNTTGRWNTASGAEALFSNQAGSQNVANGFSALLLNTEGRENTATGVYSMFRNEVGSSNTAYGAWSLHDTTGDMNTALGRSAGVNITTGNYNLLLGAGVFGEPADANTIRIGMPDGNQGPGTGQNRTFIAGIYGTQLSGTAYAVFIDENGQLGTLNPPVVLSGTGTVSVSQLQLQVQQQQKQLQEQQTTNAELRARLAKLEALLARATARR